ncbi:MAG: flagellar hook-basal body complex protein [Lachnospiraceae bacterium]|nr:flagellar hook-basal body complex protein [Lachnospiraceae bacterium]
MMRSLYSGVSGLRTHQTRMDVIGNNIANVNTTAYKAKTMNFSDMLYQTTQAGTGANPRNGTGGTNPRQIGLGVKGAAINTSITTEGANQSTGNPFDLKISGEAFFVVSDGTSTYYTRDGSFDVDDYGNLVMASTGFIVQGWGVDKEGNIVQGTVGPLNVTASNEALPEATTTGRITGIIDSKASELETENGYQVTMGIYDNAGYTYDLKFGILPATNPAAQKERKITNTENVYKMPQTIYQADISDMKFTYNERELVTIDSPEVTDQLIKAIWDEIHSNKASGTVSAPVNIIVGGGHTFGETDSVTVNLATFFDNYPELKAKVDGSSELLQMKNINVEFTGKVGFVADNTVEYPVKKSTVIDPTVVSILYDAPPTGGTSGSFAAYTIKGTIAGAGGTGSIIATAQTYIDDNGESVTVYKYEYNDGTSKQPLNVTKEQSDAMQKLLQLKIGEGIRNQYTTQEMIADTNNVIPGEFKIKLLGMTDSNGNEVSEIDSILEDSEYTVMYDTGTGKFKYVGSDGNDSFTVNLSTINSRGNFSNLTIDMSGTKNVGNENKCSLSGKKTDGAPVGKMTGV